LELLGPRLRRLHGDVRAGAHLDAAKQWREPEIGGRDVAAADDADPEFPGHCLFPHQALVDAIERREKRPISFGLSCSMTKYSALLFERSALNRPGQSIVP